jgi:hypothetical protein
VGHTCFKDLADLKKELDELRAWERIREKKPGVFYLKGIPFLHFHDEGEKRSADVKTPRGWRRVAIPLTVAARKNLMKKLRAAHQALLR